jgi:hypothetical protein
MKFHPVAILAAYLIKPSGAHRWKKDRYQNLYANPLPGTPQGNGSSSQNIENFHVVVRTFFDEDMDPNKAAIVNSEVEQELASYTGGITGSGDRNLRAPSRDLQGFCKSHCNDKKYGCKWCKINDIFAGVDCTNHCRRRETEQDSREWLTMNWNLNTRAIAIVLL